MIDLATLTELNRKAAQRARRDGVVPIAIPGAVLERIPNLQELRAEGYLIPYIGNLRPKGFRKLGDALFVDISGYGEDDEPALSIRQTLAEMKRLTRENGTLAWATISAYQFQAYLQPYRIRG